MLAAAADVVGVVGAMLICGLYLLNQMGRLETADWRFPGGNLVGSLLICLSLVEAFNLPSVVIELFWSAISVFGLARALSLRGRKAAGEAGFSLRLPFQWPRRASGTFGRLRPDPRRAPMPEGEAL